MKNSYKGVVVHCSDSSFGNAQIIEDWHKQRGWSDIGYHLVILNGQVENNTYLDFMDGELEMGRDWDIAGAHAKGYNNYLGICLIGVNSFTSLQFEMLAKVLKHLMKKFDFSLEDILFHYEVSSKTCPNFDKNWFFEQYM
jgi:N-acetylmuramoyl-L-alanine amidase